MRREMACVGVVIGLALSTAAVTQSAQGGDEVWIEASKVVVLRQERPDRGIQNETVRLSRPVSLSDLDLGARSGEAELHRRIGETAAAVCKELDALQPADAGKPERLDQRACVKRAIENAMIQAKPIIAAARQAEHE